MKKSSSKQPTIPFDESCFATQMEKHWKMFLFFIKKLMIKKNTLFFTLVCLLPFRLLLHVQISLSR